MSKRFVASLRRTTGRQRIGDAAGKSTFRMVFYDS